MGRKKIIAVFLVVGLMMTGGTVFAGDPASATLTLSSNMKCDSLTISPTTAGGTVAVGDNQLDVGTGGIAIGTSTLAGTLTSGSSGKINCAGDWSLPSVSTFTHGDGTVYFDGSTAQALSGATTFGTLYIENTAGTPGADADVESDAAVTVESAVWVSDGWFSPYDGTTFKDVFLQSSSGTLVPLGDLTVSGNWVGGVGNFTAGSGTVTFTGTSTVTSGWTSGDNKAFKNVVLNGTSVTLSTYDVKIGGTMTLTSGYWSLDGQGLEVTGAYSCEAGASLKLKGSETVVLTAGMDTDSGKLVYDTPASNINVLINPFTTVYDVEFDNGVTEYGFLLGADATVNGLLTVTDGTFSPATKNLALNGDMAVAADGTVQGGTQTVTLADGQTVTNNGTWSTAGSGTFVCGGTTTFAGSSGIAFSNFTAAGAGKTLTFQDDNTYTYGGTLTLSGSDGNLLNIVRSDNGTARPMLTKNGTSNVSFVHVNGVNGVDGKVIVAASSWGENYAYWQFGTGPKPGGGDWNSGSTWLSGHVPGASDDVTIDQPVVLDTDTTVHSLAVTAESLTLYKDTTAHSLAVTDSVSVGGTLDVGIGSLTAGAASTVTGTLSIGTGTYTANAGFDATGGNVTFTGAGTLNLGGSIACGGLGTFIRFAGCTVDYQYAGDQSVSAVDYHHVKFSGSGTKTLCGNLTEANSADVDGNLTIASGVSLDVTSSNYGIDIAGNWTNNGTFSAQAGTVTFTGSADASVGPEDASFYAVVLEKADSTAKLSPSGDQTVSSSLTITKGTFDLDTSDKNLRLGGALLIETEGRWTRSDQADKTVTFYGEGCTLTDQSDNGPQNLGHVVVEGS